VLTLGLLACGLALPAADSPPEPATLDQEYAAGIRPLLATYCFGCHGDAKQNGDVRLDTLEHRVSDKNVPVWTDARNVLDVGAMPPAETAQPTREERERLLAWVAGSIQRFEVDHRETQGDVLLRRINLRAYQNMVQTLTGVRPDLGEFQQDGTLQHFDTAGSAIYLTQDELTRFFGCAQRAIADAMATRAGPVKTLSLDRNFKQLRQEQAKPDITALQHVIDAHADAIGFATIREPPADAAWLHSEALSRVIDPAICAVYGKKSVAEVEQAGIDWKHDPACMSAVLDRLRAAVDQYQKRFDHISEFQPLAFGDDQWEYHFDAKVETPGLYRISATMRTYKAGRSLPMKFMADGRTIEHFLVDADPDAPQEYAATVYLGRGEHRLAAASSFPVAKEGDESGYFQGFVHAHYGVTTHFSFRNGHVFQDDMASLGTGDLRGFGWRKPGEPVLTLSDLHLRGPLAAMSGSTALDAALAGDVASDPSRDSAQRCILAFMKQAYAGLGNDEMAKPYVEVVMGHFARNKDFAEALSYGLAGVLSSPRFLYLDEAQRGDPGKRRPLDGRELARRLAYFLWSDLPDAELLAAAESGALREDRSLATQVRRMLMDPRSLSFRNAFTEQWLRIDRLDSIAISFELLPRYDPSLLGSARRESVAFFSEILDHDLSVVNFLDSDFVMVDNRMAMHYGIQGVTGPGFRRVELAKGSHRGGVLGQASVLIANANGTTSSLVRRGAFIMDQLLGMPPGVPPPNAPALNKIEPDGPDGEPLTQAQRLAQHRSIASCARCHDQIDALGIGLENYDAIGSWGDRLQLLVTTKNGRQAWKAHPADVAGHLPGGQAYVGPDELRACLAGNLKRFVRRLAENLLIYALGRELQSSDGPALDALCARVEGSGCGLATLIEQLVLSEQFRDK
jgi:hypothetical protein